MSLINEALKKAQKQRTGEAPTLSAMPSIGGERPVHIAKRNKPPGFDALLIRLGLGLGALIIVIVGGIFLFRGKGADSSPAGSAPTTVASTPAPAPAVSTPAVSTPPAAAPATAPASTFVVPNVTTTPATPARSEPVVAMPEPVRPTPAPVTPQVAAAPVVAPPAPAPEPVRPTAPPPQLEPRAINHIESIRVAGIRASATDPKDSKVLMNDRVYRIGNIVEAEMGLRLVEITSGSLTFEDARGGRYTRTF